MFVIGPHISIAKGFTKAAQTAVDIGANTFQFFSRNPRGGNAKEYDEKDIQKFQQIRKDIDNRERIANGQESISDNEMDESENTEENKISEEKKKTVEFIIDKTGLGADFVLTVLLLLNIIYRGKNRFLQFLERTRCVWQHSQTRQLLPTTVLP